MTIPTQRAKNHKIKLQIFAFAYFARYFKVALSVVQSLFVISHSSVCIPQAPTSTTFLSTMVIRAEKIEIRIDIVHNQIDREDKRSKGKEVFTFPNFIH